jgi:hypothetical protein
VNVRQPPSDNESEGTIMTAQLPLGNLESATLRSLEAAGVAYRSIRDGSRGDEDLLVDLAASVSIAEHIVSMWADIPDLGRVEMSPQQVEDLRIICRAGTMVVDRMRLIVSRFEQLPFVKSEPGAGLLIRLAKSVEDINDTIEDFAFAANPENREAWAEADAEIAKGNLLTREDLLRGLER